MTKSDKREREQSLSTALNIVTSKEKTVKDTRMVCYIETCALMLEYALFKLDALRTED